MLSRYEYGTHMNSNTWRHVKFCFQEMLDYKDTSNAYNNYVTGTQVHKCMYYHRSVLTVHA